VWCFRRVEIGWTDFRKIKSYYMALRRTETSYIQ